MKQISLLLSILFSFSAYAQDSNILANTSVNRITTRQIKLYNGGDAYIQEAWRMGKVIYGNGTSSYLPINYNGYNERLEWLKDGKPMTFDVPVNSFILGDTSLANGYLFMSGFYPIEQQTAYSYYQVLYQSPTSKVVKYVQYKTLEKRNFNEANVNVKFEPFESYYFVDQSNHLTRIKSNKKSIIALFPSRSDALEKYLDEEGIKIKTWDDVINVIGYAEMN